MATPVVPHAQVPRSARRTTAALTAYAAARAEAMERFLVHGRIRKLWRALTAATDKLVAGLVPGGITVLAVGGYGRREMFPFSDVDVLVLLPEKGGAGDAEKVVAMLQHLWDMRVPVSHAVRSVEETVVAACGDATIAASLMDARLLSGDRKRYLTLKKRLKKEVYGVEPRRFVEDKLGEREARHAKWGDSRFLLEPNVKDGKGGLRDLQTLTWLARYCYGVKQVHDVVHPDLLREDEWEHFTAAYEFYATVRAYMHVLRGRAEERLTFDLQTDIAARMKFPGDTAQARAERFMQRYFDLGRQVGNLTRIFCAILEEENLRVPHAPFAQDISGQLPEYLQVRSGRIGYAPKTSLTPERLLALFVAGERHGLDIHPRAHLQLSRALPRLAKELPQSAEANALLLELLLSRRHPQLALQRLSETGVLAAILPEFAGITGQMQYDGYHTYTVDEHTLRAVGNLFTLESGAWAQDMPLATRLARAIQDRAPLYLAMLCHDIAKGMGGGHAEKGEAQVLAIARRLGFSDGQGELAAWLVKHHLLLSEVAFKRDLEDAKTIEDFIATVQSPERLRLLVLLTVADIKAVGPGIWNRWKGSLMRELYYRAQTAMGVEERGDSVLAAMPEHAAHQRWQAAPDVPAIVIVHDAFRAITQIDICLTHRPGLFRLLTGVMSWMGASIVSARIRVKPDGAAIATLGIQDAHEQSFAAEDRRLGELPKLLEKALAGKLDFAAELPKRRVVSKRGRQVAVQPAVYIDNRISAQATVVEVNAPDRLGLLYDMLGAFEACQLQVMTAHIATYGSKAVDVFYVKDAFGLKLDHPAKLDQLHKALTEALAEHG